jgi:small subunit ribosomal protein S1
MSSSNPNPLSSPPPVAPEETAPVVEDSNFGDILSAFEQEHAAPEGEAAGALTGTVAAFSDDYVIVDIGRKTDGLIPIERAKDAEGNLTLAKGDSLTVSISGRDNMGNYLLSLFMTEKPRDLSGIKAAFEEKRTVTGKVLEMVKGGFRVDVGERAFLPASRSGIREMTDMPALVGQEIQVRITKFEEEEGKADIVVDRRVVLEEEEKQKREEAFASLKEDTVIRGTVRSLTEFGAFVNIAPGVDGLLHVTDLAWTRIAKPADVLNVGDTVEVKILKIHPNSKKISLGMKQLVPDPWTVAAEKYKAGDRIRGKVVRLADFGAFVEIEPGVDGLVHLTDLSWSKKIKKASDAVKVGEQVEVVVLGVKPADKRISLSLKQALGDPWDDVVKKYPSGSVVNGTVTALEKFGAFVDIGDGIEGMIHVGDITHEKRLDHPKDMLQVGQTVSAQVLEIDKERRRLRLGMKQLQPTSTDQFITEHEVGQAVTGRVVEVREERAKIDLGDGIFAVCRFKSETKETGGRTVAAADVGSLAAMLSQHFKTGGGTGKDKGPAVKPGEVRSFKISALDAATKRIDLELE